MTSEEDLVQVLISAMIIKAQPQFYQRSLGRPETLLGLDTDWPTWSFVVRL